MARAKRCKGERTAGGRCRARPLRDRDYCRAHDPELAEAERFGSHEQATAAAGGGGRPRKPRPTEVMRERIEAEVDRILATYFEGLEATLTATHHGGTFTSDLPDHATRIAAAEKLLDRVYGRPRQVTELTGEDGGPIEVGSTWDLQILSDEELAHLQALMAKAGAR